MSVQKSLTLPSLAPAASLPETIAGRLQQAVPGLWYMLFLVLYLLPGVVGHDPWKQDETYSFSMVLHILSSGDWVVPTVAGEPFMEKPPFYYLVAAGSAWLLKGWLPLHDGARLASLLFMALALCAVDRAGRALQPQARHAAPLLLLANLGLLLHAHTLLTDIGLTAGTALALLGLLRLPERPMLGAALLGSGGGMALMTKGLLIPGVLGLSIVAMALAQPAWRRHWNVRIVAATLLWAAPWLLVWPCALYLRSPELFHDWFWLNNIGRFFGFSVGQLGAANEPGFYLRNVPWFTFPALPLAAWGLYRRRRELPGRHDWQLLLVFSAILLAVLSRSASARAQYLLPLLPALSLLATLGLPAGAHALRYLGRAALALSIALTGLAWLLWASITLQLPLVPLSWLAHWLPLHYRMPVQPGAILLALALPLLLLAAGRQLAGRLPRPLLHWVGALALLWGSVMTLLLPWIDEAKSYRTPLVELSGELQGPAACVGRINVGESERSMLEYITGTVTKTIDPQGAARCPQLLVGGRRRHIVEPDARLWQLRWEGHRPGDDSELLRLYQRRNQVSASLTGPPRSRG
ncbi:glycosyltransferase family 39 protein [Chitinivorax sp. PXF-14]|uniref:ArnT family glycosyltransferase n=1 Tax=Chitinivorax sp. PXF-14 TaxID=3230488 RepID=UPI003466E5A1